MPFGFGSKKRITSDPLEVVGAEGEISSGAVLPEIQENVSQAPPHVQLSDEEAAARLKLYKIGASVDPNLPTEDVDALDVALQTRDVNKENALVSELIEDSPYPEVGLRRPLIRNQSLLMRNG